MKQTPNNPRFAAQPLLCASHKVLKLVFRSFLLSLFLPLPFLESGAFFYPKVFIKVP